jgi:hypothetical protein
MAVSVRARRHLAQSRPRPRAALGIVAFGRDLFFGGHRFRSRPHSGVISLVVQDTREAGHRKPEAHAKLLSISGSVTISVIGSIGDGSNPSLR